VTNLLQPKDQIVLAGYCGVIRYPDGLVEIGYRFSLGRVVGVERNEPAEKRQVGIERVMGKGTWRSKRPEIRYDPPRPGADGEEPPLIWFRWAELHPCAGVKLVNGSTRESLTPELFGVQIDERVVLKLAPNGAIAKYQMRGERFLTPEEIGWLWRLGVPAGPGARRPVGGKRDEVRTGSVDSGVPGRRVRGRSRPS
jgi:hypothetical protein